ncbi:ParB/RepB/Spo0J family partition protein [Streptococcus loxodontisalivarius]|uniref:ParB family chromosome partitioning protein n=1 Tax=Streptococcus loxodontisalivarius TaxID=1349415 RepID=A0ABS2PPC0_9STRE|nr:ParB/RepB/Spo0J family partition protein [Streptococcus loxodontisalivarius]MBM7641882.1 ParB family chromosome partitioning protein [Streptococcus loxodontisalivarius]
MTDQLKTVPIDLISPNPFQPRLHFNTQEIAELAQSISENGLIQPLIVRPSDIFGYELVAGERRLRAAKLAGLKEIDVLIKEMTDSDSMRQAIIENLQRSDLNPIEEAKSYKQLIERTQMTHEEIASSMGKSRPYISNSLRLLNLDYPLQEALEAGQISQGHARLLLSLDSNQEQMNWLHKITNDKLSVHQLEKALKEQKEKRSKKKRKNIFIEEQEKQLSQSLGLKVDLTYSKEAKGKLTINFSNQEDFHRLINKLL